MIRFRISSKYIFYLLIIGSIESREKRLQRSNHLQKKPFSNVSAFQKTPERTQKNCITFLFSNKKNKQESTFELLLIQRIFKLGFCMNSEIVAVLGKPFNDNHVILRSYYSHTNGQQLGPVISSHLEILFMV